MMERLVIDDADRELLMILAFIVFFPASLVFIAARWLIWRRKTLIRSTAAPE